jgi:hypothetical protein
VTVSATQPGRPRDPSVDQRVADAAIALVGGATVHVQSTPPDRREALRAGAARYAGQLVDFLLSAVHSAQPA